MARGLTLALLVWLHALCVCPLWARAGPAWPTHGEIDIIEGVNVNTEVVSTLHTNSGCSQSGVNNSQFTGHYGNNNAGGRADDCDVKAPKQGNNQGCGINGQSPPIARVPPPRVGRWPCSQLLWRRGHLPRAASSRASRPRCPAARG